MTLYHAVFTAYANDDESNPFVSSFTYDINDITPSSAIATAFAQSLWANLIDAAGGWKDIVQIGMDAHSVVVTCPPVPTVLGITTGAVAGTRTGTQMPRFVTWGFKSERLRADIRAGFKRFGLISETDTSGQVPTTGMLTILNTFAQLLRASLEVDDGVSAYEAVPIIVKRVKYTTPSGKDAYRLPGAGDPYEYYLAQNWNYQWITTQNSRKL